MRLQCHKGRHQGKETSGLQGKARRPDKLGMLEGQCMGRFT